MIWLLRWLRKDREKLVHTMKLPIVRSISKEKGFLVVHFYETQSGGKRLSLSSINFTIQEKTARELLETFEEYHDIIVPWMAGRYTPDIPTYEDIDQIDLMEKLKQ